MHIHVHHHHEFEPELAEQLSRLNDNLERFMSDIDDFITATLAKISAQKTQIDSLAALLSGIKHQLADALTGESLSPAAKTKLAGIMPVLEANTGEITDAINANTDPAPPVVAPPVVAPPVADPVVPPAATPDPTPASPPPSTPAV